DEAARRKQPSERFAATLPATQPLAECSAAVRFVALCLPLQSSLQVRWEYLRQKIVKCNISNAGNGLRLVVSGRSRDSLGTPMGRPWKLWIFFVESPRHSGK